MNKNHVDTIDGARDVHVGDVNHYGKKKFDGDYGKSDCSSKRYRYVGFGARAVLFGLFVLPVVLFLVYCFSTDQNALSLIMKNRISPFWQIGWGGFLFVVFLILPFLHKSFSIDFQPKNGVLYVGKKKYLFDDMMDIEWFPDGDLVMLPKDGSNRVLLTLRPSRAKYIGQCIGRLWSS